MSTSTLHMAVEGCCKGHKCDNCKTCQRGRCCRKDNPDYKLPQLGEWDGPVYGELGCLTDDGDKVQCHICGDYFHVLGMHTLYIHDVNQREYCALFGFAFNRALAGPTKIAHHRAANSQLSNNNARMKALQDGAAKWRGTRTTEQFSALVTQNYERLGQVPAWKAVHQANWARNPGPPSGIRIKTSCPRGHEYAGHNLILSTIKSGSNAGKIKQVCRICHNERQRLRARARRLRSKIGALP